MIQKNKKNTEKIQKYKNTKKNCKKNTKKYKQNKK